MGVCADFVKRLGGNAFLSALHCCQETVRNAAQLPELFPAHLMGFPDLADPCPHICIEIFFQFHFLFYCEFAGRFLAAGCFYGNRCYSFLHRGNCPKFIYLCHFFVGGAPFQGIGG